MAHILVLVVHQTFSIETFEYAGAERFPLVHKHGQLGSVGLWKAEIPFGVTDYRCNMPI